MAAWASFRGLEDGERNERCPWEYDSTWESEAGEELEEEEEEEEGKWPRTAGAAREEEEEEEEEEKKPAECVRGSHQASGAQMVLFIKDVAYVFVENSFSSYSFRCPGAEHHGPDPAKHLSPGPKSIEVDGKIPINFSNLWIRPLIHRYSLKSMGLSRQERRRPAVSSMGYRGFEFSTGRNWTAAKDMQRYRHHYPGLEEREADAEEEEMWNLSFYKNEISFLPHGLYIDELLEAWQEDYETLEENHSYIQWLFPLRERGMNWRAKPLTCKEIQAFRKSKEVMQRFVRAYKLMLGFYGINLIDQETGQVRKAENWIQRFRNLDRFSHNNLRITRILKCLGEMGYEHYQVHLVKFFLKETLISQTLPNVKRSALDYFLFTIRSKQKRRELIHYAWKHFKPQSRFVWGPHKKLLKYKPPLSKSQHCRRADEEQESIRHEAVGKKKKEEKVGDAADLQTKKVTDECASEDQSQHGAMYIAERGDSIEEKQASLPQLEEKILSEAPGGMGDEAESECLKESKKRKLEMHRLSGKCTELLKNSTDIEKISHNLGEFAINQEITETVPALAEMDDQVTAEEGDRSSEDLKMTESSDAPVKRRKVDEAMPENSALNVELNLDADTTTCNVQAAEPDAMGCGTEKGVNEENKVVEETHVETETDADGASVNSLPSSKTNEPELPSPAGSGSVSHEANAEIQNEGHQCNETLPASDSQADDREQKEGEEDVNARGEAKTPDKNQGHEGLQQSVVASGPEKANARDIAQETDGFEDSAELNDKQAMAESGKNIVIASEQGKERKAHDILNARSMAQ